MRMVIGIVIYTAILATQSAIGIVNNRNNSTVHYYPRKEYIKKISYLDGDRPLWVLDDKVIRHGEIDITTQRPFRSRHKFITPSRYIPKLPSHYVNLDSAMISIPSSSVNQTPPRSQKHLGNQRTSFPFFDDLEMESDSDPIFIYRGPKAKMIFNTMMTSRKYPMQEPIPGQVLYPPYSPKFKPTPVVERIRPPDSIFQNLTLIPFYAHEAIDPRNLRNKEMPPEVTQNSIENPIELSQSEDYNKPTCYHSYYSQDEVQAKYWSFPFSTPPPPPEPATEMSLNHQIVAPDAFYPNHRMEATTQLPQLPPVNSFRIFYDRDSDIEKPSPKPRYKTVHTAKYGGFKTIYPIYTLNKLLKYNPHKQFQTISSSTAKRKRRLTPPLEETWLFYKTRGESPPTIRTT